MNQKNWNETFRKLGHFVMFPVLFSVVLSSGLSVRGEEISVRIPAQRIDAEPGGKVAISYSGDLQSFLRARSGNFTNTASPSNWVGTAKIGDAPIVEVNLSTNQDVLEFIVPAELGQNQKQEVDYTAYISITEGTNSLQLPGHVVLTVYPRSSPIVTSINDAGAGQVAYVRPEEPFTVNGHGFFAPADKIAFVVTGQQPGSDENIFMAETMSVAHDGTSFTAVFSRSQLPPIGERTFTILFWDRVVPGNTHSIWVENLTNKKPGWAACLALVPVFLMVLVVLGLTGLVQKGLTNNNFEIEERSRLSRFLRTLFVDPTTNTYSLARLQFAGWLVVLVYSYGFVFVTKGFVADLWSFPKFAGGEVAFLISLGTLVGSVATTTIVGPQGAGAVKPRARDFIVHGGVLAFDRIQQLVWTFVAMAMFLTIVVREAGTVESLPTIPPDLLNLMGLSSLGYLAGKAVRKAGPVIRTVVKDGQMLQVLGLNLSVHANVLIDEKDVSIDLKQFETDKAREMRNMILVKGDYDPAKIKVTVINPDGQESNWVQSSLAAAS